jgi:hypothetical protein
MKQRNKLLLVCALFGTLNITLISAFDVTIVNSTSDILASKKVCLRLRLAANEHGLCHETMRFSVDAPWLALKRWNTSARTLESFDPITKNNRLLYTQSFFANIFIEIPTDKENQLDQVTLCVACFVVGNDGKTRPKTVTTAFVAHQQVLPANQQPPALTNQTKPETFIPLEKPTNNKQHVKHFSKDFAFIDQLSDLWNKLTNFFVNFAHSKGFWQLYIFLIALYLLFLLKKRFLFLRYLLPFSQAWEIELRRASLWLFIGMSMYTATLFISTYWCWFITAFFMFLMMLYYCSIDYLDKTFLGKLKSLIGFVCGALVIPFILQAIFALYHNNIFELFH